VRIIWPVVVALCRDGCLAVSFFDDQGENVVSEFWRELGEEGACILLIEWLFAGLETVEEVAGDFWMGRGFGWRRRGRIRDSKRIERVPRMGYVWVGIRSAILLARFRLQLRLMQRLQPSGSGSL
jgi:hypothetical protein